MLPQKLDLPIPASEQVFEDLCRDLWRRLWDDPKALKHGRRGQAQSGVDIFGWSAKDSRWEGVQCKLRGPGRNLKPSEIKSEAIKAEGFEDLGCLIIATTSRRDTVIQRYVRRLSKEWEGRGLFSVHIFAWDDIVDELHNYEDLVLKYYLKPFDRFDDGSPAESLVSIGAPRSETGLGDLESGEGSESWVLEVRAAVDRQDYAALRQMVVKFQGSEVLDTSQQSEFSLYSTLLAYHDGNLSDAQEILARSGPNASSEARIRTALWLLQVGRVAEARFLVDLEINPSSPVVNILAEAVRIWASLSTSISIGTRVRIEEVDELAQSASMVDAPATLWLCFARLALRLGDHYRAASWLRQVGGTARESVDYLHVAALNLMQSIVRQRLENPYRSISEEGREKLAQACSWLSTACVRDQSVVTRADLIRDLGVAQELLAGVKEGIERETQLVTAAKTYERAATTDDGMSALWARAGHCWLLASRYQEAIESYRKTPEELLDWIQKSDLAAALLLSGQTESALASIATILNQDLAPWQALFNAAIVLHLSGHSETAARALEDARARAGKSGWRVELLLGMVYRTLGDSDREENAFRQAMYQRGVLDAQICQAFGRAFQANTESRLRRRISEFRRDFRRFHAKTDAVDRLEADLGAAVEAYFNWLAQFVEAGGRSSGLLAEALQQSFELLNSLNKKLTRLEEIKRGKDRWPADFFIESVSTTASGRDPLKANNREAVMPPADAVLTMDWQAMQSRASSKLQVLPIQTSLVLQDPILLEGLGQIQSTAADTYAHRLSIIARIFEVQTSAMLRCYDSLSNRSGKVTVLHKAYQERTIQRVFSRMQGRAILADDVGLGKTVEAGLCLIEYRLRRLVRRCLILVPTIDLARQWQHELEDKLGHHPPFSWTVGRSNPGKRQDIMSVDTWIATYQVAIRHQADYLRVEWDMVIADEAHHLANRSSETYKFVKQLRSPHLLLLTATPIQHSVNDLFSLITIIRPGLFSSLRAYRTFFSDDALADQAQRGAVARLLSQVMIRNTLLAVADQAFTGRRVFKNIPVKLGKSELSFYENVTNMVLALGKAVRRGRLPMEYYSIAKMASSSARATFVAIDRMAREANRSNREVRLIRDWYEELAPLLADIVTPAKALVVKNILREISSRKALIFVEFRETALQLEEKLGIPAIHGKISQAKREAIIKDFENNNSVRALVATRGFAEGLNLAFCSVLINYDLPWNPMRIEQRIGRIQRIGQHHPEVLIYSLAASGTIEEEIRDALMRKVDLFQRVLGEIGLDLASITDGRIITARLRAILKEASNLADLRDRVRRFFEEVMPPVVSEDSL